jgi:hypothetical protein
MGVRGGVLFDDERWCCRCISSRTIARAGGCGMEITVSTYRTHNNITSKYFPIYRNWVQGLLHAIALSQGKGLRLMLVGKTFTTGCLGEVSG